MVVVVAVVVAIIAITVTTTTTNTTSINYRGFCNSCDDITLSKMYSNVVSRYIIYIAFVLTNSMKLIFFVFHLKHIPYENSS